MTKLKIKIIGLIITIIAILPIMSTVSMAVGSLNATISSTTVTVGDTFTVTATATKAAGTYSVTANNANASITGTASGFLDSNSEKWTFKANKAGTVNITVKATDITDADDDTKSVTGTKVFTVTIKEKTTTPSGNTGSSSSSTNSSSSSNTTTPKVEAPTFTTVNRKVYTTGSVNLRDSWSTTSKATGVAKGTELTLTGTSTQRVNNYIWYRVQYNGATKYIASNLVTNTKPEEPKEDEKSSNNNLTSLTIKGVTLSPEFSNDVLQYTAKLEDETITKLEIEAKPEYNKAKVVIEGNDSLHDGENKVVITVTAEDNTTKTYTITVTKGEETLPTNTEPVDNTLKLSELKIAGVNFADGFKPEQYNYELSLNNITESLEITATPNQEGAKIEIIGNQNFKEGENIVTILLTSTDGNETATYQIKVNLSTGTPEPKNDMQFYFICGGAIGVAIIVLIIIIIVTTKKDKDNDEFEDDDNENENSGYEIREEKQDNRVTVDDLFANSNLEDEPNKKAKGRHSV